MFFLLFCFVLFFTIKHDISKWFYADNFCLVVNILSLHFLEWFSSVILSITVPLTTDVINYSQGLNNTGLKCAGPLIWGHFSIYLWLHAVQTCVVQRSTVFVTLVGNLRMWKADLLFADFQLCRWSVPQLQHCSRVNCIRDFSFLVFSCHELRWVLNIELILHSWDKHYLVMTLSIWYVDGFYLLMLCCRFSCLCSWRMLVCSLLFLYFSVFVTRAMLTS